MSRPCFLVIDREHAGSISTRKLVIETAKLNVITAFSAEEALETLSRFPAVDAVVLDSNMPGMPCSDLIDALKRIQPGMPIIAIGAAAHHRCEQADHVLDSFEPPKLLSFLRDLLPAARQVMQGDYEMREAQ